MATVPVSTAAPSPVTYGSIIPITTGLRRVTGQIIWTSNFKTVQGPGAFLSGVGAASGGSAGGGSGGGLSPGLPSPGSPLVSASPYGVSADFAVSFGYSLLTADQKATVGIVQLWANNTLIYDATDPTNIKRLPGISFSTYPGAPDQTPDLVIAQSSKGGGQGDLTPGYRDLIYIVFSDFDLTVYGSTLPTISALLVDSLALTNTTTEFTRIDDDDKPGSTGSFVDFISGLFYTWSNITSDTPELHTYTMSSPYDAAHLNEVSRRTLSVDVNQDNIYFDFEYQCIVTVDEEISNSVKMKAIDIAQGLAVGQVGVNSASVAQDATHIKYPSEAAIVKCLDSDGNERHCIFHVSTYGSVACGLVAMAGNVPNVGALTIDGFKTLGSGDKVHGVCAYPLVAARSKTTTIGKQQDAVVFYGIGTQLHGQLIGIRAGRFTFMDIFGSSIIAGPFKDAIKDFSPYEVQNVFVDTSSDALMIFLKHPTNLDFKLARVEIQLAGIIEGSSDVANDSYLFFKGVIASPALTSFNVAMPASVTGTDAPHIRAYQQSTTDNGFIVTLGASWFKINLRNGAVESLTNDYGSGNDWFYYDTNGMIVVPGSGSNEAAIVQLDILSGYGSSLGDVLRALATRAGYADADISVDAALDDTVTGVQIDKAYTVDQLWTDLGQAYDFKVFESEGKIKFVRVDRGDTDIDVTLTADDLAAVAEGTAFGNENVISKISSIANVPQGLTLNYIDPALGYVQSAQTSSNGSSVDPTTAGTLQATLNLPIVMTATEAFQRVSKALIEVAETSSTQQFRLPWSFMAIEPTDKVSIPVNSFVYTIRVTDVIYNADWTLSITGDNVDFTTNIFLDGDGGFVGIPQTIAGLSDSLPVIFDIPLIQPSDDANGAVVYTAVASFGQASWAGAVLYRSETNLYHTSQQAVYGVLITALPADDQPWHTDETTVIDLAIQAGSTDLFIGTDTTGLNVGSNALLIAAGTAWELIYFRDVTVINSRHVQLTGLRRGRRGTDPQCGQHAIGDKAYLVRSGGAASILHTEVEPLTAIGLTDGYKAVGDSYQLTPRTVNVTLYGNSLRPWAPSRFTATLDGSDVVLGWSPRNRLVHPGIVFDTPLDDPSNFEVEILNGDTIIRTLNSTTTAVTYTELMQTSDGFVAPVDAVKMRVYQISNTVGRGFARGGTADVE